MNKIIKKAVVRDYRDFVAGKSCNGGCYGFWTVYELSNEDELRAGVDPCPYYEVGFGTTADFDYCEYCGSFGSCGCDKEPQLVREERVLEALSEAEGDPSTAVSGKILETVEIGGADSLDWTKIRRRCEDALRKAEPYVIFRVSKYLGVKLFTP